MKRDYQNQKGQAMLAQEVKNKNEEKGGKVMNKIKKLVLGTATLLTAIILGSSVHAADFTSRIINKSNTNLESSGTVTIKPSSSSTSSLNNEVIAKWKSLAGNDLRYMDTKRVGS